MRSGLNIVHIAPTQQPPRLLKNKIYTVYRRLVQITDILLRIKKKQLYTQTLNYSAILKTTVSQPEASFNVTSITLGQYTSSELNKIPNTELFSKIFTFLFCSQSIEQLQLGA